MTSLLNFRRQNTLVFTLISIFVGFIIIASVTLYFAVKTQAQREATYLAVNSAQQAALVVRPMMISNDYTSIKVVLNEMARSQFLAGVTLKSSDDHQLAHSGETSQLSHLFTLAFQGKDLGHLELWIDTSHNESALIKLLMLAMAISFAALACMTYAGAMYVRTQRTSQSDLAQQPQQVSQPPVKHSPAQVASTPPEIKRIEEEIFNDDLLDAFSSKHVTTDPTAKPQAESEQPKKPLSMASDEDQIPGISGYSLDAQLTDSLPENEALYLLYIDLLSGHAHYLEDDERAERTSNYKQIAQKIAVSYNSELTVLDNGCFLMSFNAQAASANQGIDAICAALTFTLATKAVNKALISKMSPVLNIRIALVRGNAQNAQPLLNEAVYLTRHTETNELISHTALTESPLMANSVLANAKIRRKEEDKVEILAVDAAKQAIFEKQALTLCKIQ